MTLAPLLAAPLHIQVHVAAALVAALLTPVQFWGPRKGSPAHRGAGYVWLMAMLVVAISSFWINSKFRLNFLGFSPIHLFSIFTPFSVAMIIHHARARRIEAHRGWVIGLALGFWIAGAFTFLPPRLMWRLVAG